MNNTGIIRKIDNLGRIVLPKELRYNFNINAGDDFEISIDGNKIILTKYSKVMNYENEILKIIKTFNENISFKIYMIVQNTLLGTQDKIDEGLNKMLQERKIIKNISSNKLTDNIVLEENNILFPIIRNSDILGALISVGHENVNNMESILKILSNLIINKIVE